MRMDKGARWGIFWFLYYNAGSDLFLLFGCSSSKGEVAGNQG